MTGNVVLSEVDLPMYVAVSRADKHVHYGELVCTPEYIICSSRRCIAQTEVVITDLICVRFCTARERTG
jgi:hypothetical protein